MTRTSNIKCRPFVTAKQPFTASNLCGQDHPFAYVVLSYKWYPLFIYSKATYQWFSNKDKYSVSTSKQYGQAHPHVNCIELTHDEMKFMLAQHGVIL